MSMRLKTSLHLIYTIIAATVYAPFEDSVRREVSTIRSVCERERERARAREREREKERARERASERESSQVQVKRANRG